MLKDFFVYLELQLIQSENEEIAPRLDHTEREVEKLEALLSDRDTGRNKSMHA